MAVSKKQILAAKKFRGRFQSTFNYDLAIRICERVAEGDTLSAVCAEEGMPDRKTFRQWCVRDEKVMQAYEAARLVKSHSLFDEVLDITRKLKTETLDNAKVNAFRVALDNLRWAAGKLNPREYGDKLPNTPAIAIQINTPLNLGKQDKQPISGSNLYTLTVPVAGQEGAGGSSATIEADPRLLLPASRAGTTKKATEDESNEQA